MVGGLGNHPEADVWRRLFGRAVQDHGGANLILAAKDGQELALKVDANPDRPSGGTIISNEFSVVKLVLDLEQAAHRPELSVRQRKLGQGSGRVGNSAVAPLSQPGFVRPAQLERRKVALMLELIERQQHE
jgi:hypothetical protein